MSGPGGPRSGKIKALVKRIHPFVWGHIAAAVIAGASVGATLDAQAAIMGAIMLAAGAVISSTICWWKPGLDAPAWQLIGNRRGWNCLGMAIAVMVAGVCLVPPFGGRLWRWWKHRAAQA